jgi:fatty acid desaturase
VCTAQARTAVDYSSDSHLWRFLTGGLNVQTLHHVLPGVSNCHYTALYPKYEAVCRKHGVQLAQRRGVLHAARTALAHVHSINRGALSRHA